MDKNLLVERDILVYAMRYAMGRMTFAPTIVIENIKHNIELFNDDSIKLLIRDIDSFGKVSSFGMECDMREWTNFKSYLESRLEFNNNII